MWIMEGKWKLLHFCRVYIWGHSSLQVLINNNEVPPAGFVAYFISPRYLATVAARLFVKGRRAAWDVLLNSRNPRYLPEIQPGKFHNCRAQVLAA